MITFEPADARRDRAVLTELNVAYLDWLDANIRQAFGLDLPALLGQSIAEYVAGTLEKLCAAEPPEGAFYLVSRDGEVVGSTEVDLVAMVGEFRVHYAGFFDPGFGWADAGGAGSRGVLEVRCHEAPFVLEHGQIVGRLVYERMAEAPATLYGREIKSNYQGQGLKLAKQFQAS